jgi:hypothetical protein
VDDGGDAPGGLFESGAVYEIDPDVADAGQALGRTLPGRGRNDLVAPAGEFPD